MLIVVAIAAALGAGIWAVREYERRENYRRALDMFGAVGSRSHFVSVQGWRAYLQECEDAESYLNRLPRHFKGAAKSWSDAVEARWQQYRSRTPEFEAVPALSATEPDVIVRLPSGLQYQTLRVGRGPRAEAGRLVSVHYETLIVPSVDVIDSSRQSGRRPFEFRVGSNTAIRGMELGVAGMSVGEIRRLTIPPDLAYRDLGNGSFIPPNSTLELEVELIEVRD